MNQLFHRIIDELHNDYKPISDEEQVSEFDDHGIFQREFMHTSGQKYLLRWSVWYGTPETVRTTFESIQKLS